MSEGAGAGAGAEGGAVADVSSASVDAGAVAGEGVSAEVAEMLDLDAVSYTHLTLPTICSV